MSVLFIALPVSLLIGVIAVITFVLQVKKGQFDDLETPSRRMLYDDVDAVRSSTESRSQSARDV